MSARKMTLALALAAAAGSARAEPMTFAEALARADRTAPSLAAAELQVEAARQAARAAAELPDPRLNFGLGNLPISGSMAGRLDAEPMTMATVGVMQEVPSRAKRRAQGLRAEARVTEAQAEMAVERRTARLGAALGWIDLHYAGRRLEVMDEVIASLDPLWKAAPAGVASGSARPAQALQAEQMRAALLDRRSELAAAEVRARAELARWVEDAAPQAFGAPPEPVLDPDQLRAELSLNPDLRRREAAESAAEGEAALARAERRPDWSWELAYHRRDPLFGDMVSIGGSVSLPLFADRRQAPVIAARQAQLQSARLSREAERRALAAALEAELAEHHMHHEQLARAREVLTPLARRRAEAERASYAARTAGLTEVVEAFTGLAEARLTELDREAQTLRDAVRLSITYGSEGR